MRQKREKDGYAHLCQAEKASLPYGLGCMFAQILIIVVLKDGQELFDSVSQVLTEDDGELFSDGTLVRHQAISFPKMRRKRQLVCLSLPDGRPSHHLGLLRCMVTLV